MQLLGNGQHDCAIQTVAGELKLSAHRVAYSPEYRALFVADVHFGKARTFRQLGVPVPAGTTQANLDRLSAAIARYAPIHLYFLGDLLHSRHAQHDSLLIPLHEWRSLHGQVQMTLVRGNHDAAAGDPPATLGIDLVQEPFTLGEFELRHHPVQKPTRGFSLAGHLHPVTVLKGRARSRVRLDCFVSDSHQLLLPAFGEFTGGFLVQASPGRMIFPLLTPD